VCAISEMFVNTKYVSLGQYKYANISLRDNVINSNMSCLDDKLVDSLS